MSHTLRGVPRVGVYRLWRDGGYALGALLAGFIADLLGLRSAIGAVGVLTVVSGLVALLMMQETLPGGQMSRTIPELHTAPKST